MPRLVQTEAMRKQREQEKAMQRTAAMPDNLYRDKISAMDAARAAINAYNAYKEKQ